jgi:hypothetical protein
MLQDNLPKWFMVGLIAMGLLFIGIGIGFHVWASGRAAEAAQWPSADGEVVAAYVETRSNSSSGSRGSRGTSYAPVVIYRYAADGQSYQNNRIWVAAEQSFGFASSARDFIDRYPVGSRVRVLYDPADPTDSALINDGAPWWFWLFVVFGVMILVFGLFIPRLFAGGPRLERPLSSRMRSRRPRP